MYRKVSYEKSVQILQTVMVNHFYGWLRLPMTNLIDRQDIIRFCCSRSWQAEHILRAIFALNQIDYSGDYTHADRAVDILPRQPYSASDKLRRLTCSSDFRSAAIAGLDLIREILTLADMYYPEVHVESFLKSVSHTDLSSTSVEQKKHLARTTVSAYACISGIQGIIINGSLARGLADETSDIDLVAYCTVIPDVDSRKSHTRMIDEKSQVVPESDRLMIDGTYVHIDFESVFKVESSFASPHPALWALGTWEPIQTGEIAWDPDLIVQKWKVMISDMPSEPKKSLITELLQCLHSEERNFNIAVMNDDPIYCSIILGNVLTFYFQILCIINHRFITFPKWMHHVVNEINLKPDNVLNRFYQMLSLDLYQPTLAKLSAELRALVSDLTALIKKESMLF